MEKNLLGLQNNNTLASTLAPPKKTNGINVLDMSEAEAAVRQDNSYKSIQEQANQTAEKNAQLTGNNFPKDTAVSANNAIEKTDNNQEIKTDTTEIDGNILSIKTSDQLKTQKITHKDTANESDEIGENIDINRLINLEVTREVMPVMVEDESSVSENTSFSATSTAIDFAKSSANTFFFAENTELIKTKITNATTNNVGVFNSAPEFPVLDMRDDAVLANIDGVQEDGKAMNERLALELDKTDIESEAAIHKKIVKELASTTPIDEVEVSKTTIAVIDSIIKPESTMIKEKMSATDIMSNTQISDIKLITNTHAGKLTYIPEAKPENPLSDKILLMMNKNDSSAKLIIDPPELGALEIKISQHEGATHIVFNTQSAIAKEAIEAQINDLKNIFGQEGLNLGNVDVFHQNQQNNNEQTTSGHGGFAHTNEATSTESIVLVKSIKGLVDLYA